MKLKMRKIISMLCAIFMLFALSACGSSGIPREDYEAVVAERDELQRQVDELRERLDGQNEVGDKSDASLPPSTSGAVSGTPGAAGEFDVNAVAEQLVVRQYSYVDAIKTPWVYLVIENTSDFTLSVSASLETFGANGGLIGAKSAEENAVGAGQTTILSYMLDEPFETSEYELSVSEEEWYAPITQNLSYESSSASNKEVLTVTNNGDIAAEFVEAHALFFSGDVLVGYDSRYFIDDDSELKPGASISGELSCYETYDSFFVVFAGRA